MIARKYEIAVKKAVNIVIILPSVKDSGKKFASTRILGLGKDLFG